MAILSTTAPTTLLRQRMQDDMVLRGLEPHTQQDYVRHVRRFATFLGRSPDVATPEDVRHFQLSQHENGVGATTINGAVSALRFLFTVTLRRREPARALVVTRNPRKLPDVLSVEEAGRLLEAAPGIKYKAALPVARGFLHERLSYAKAPETLSHNSHQPRRTICPASRRLTSMRLASVLDPLRIPPALCADRHVGKLSNRIIDQPAVLSTRDLNSAGA